MTSDDPLVPLRAGVRLVRTSPRAFCLIDPEGGAHFDVGPRERFLITMLEHCETREELREAYRERFDAELSSRDCDAFLEQLRRHGLLEGTTIEPAPIVDGIPHQSALPMQLRDGAANVFFDMLALLFGWLLHPAWLIVVAALLLTEVTMVWQGWSRVMQEVDNARYEVPLVPLFLLSYAQTILLMNLPMALSMGICCRKYRGRVRSFGLTWGNWVLPTIAFYTDIGDSIVGMSPRGRRTQIALGILGPLTLGACYAMFWGASSRAHDAHRFWSLMVIPCAVVALYQCNPFSVATSAHWGLASWLDNWRLHSRAIEETKAWFWTRTSPEALTRRERFWLRVYGITHYALRFSAGLGLLGGAGYAVTRLWGAPGAALLTVLFLWWNREYFSPVWRWSGMSFTELAERWKSLRRGWSRSASLGKARQS